MDDYTFRSRVRDIVRSEMFKRDMGDWFFGNPVMESSVRNAVEGYLDRNLNGIVSNQILNVTKGIKTDALTHINDFMKNDMRVNAMVEDSIKRTQSMVTVEIAKGADQLRATIDAEKGRILRTDEFNALNQTALGGIKTHAKQEIRY